MPQFKKTYAEVLGEDNMKTPFAVFMDRMSISGRAHIGITNNETGERIDLVSTAAVDDAYVSRFRAEWTKRCTPKDKGGLGWSWEEVNNYLLNWSTKGPGVALGLKVDTSERRTARNTAGVAPVAVI